MIYQKHDRVVVKGLDMAFVVDSYLNDDLIKLLIEGESPQERHYVIHARPEVLLPNNEETCVQEGWIKSS